VVQLGVPPVVPGEHGRRERHDDGQGDEEEKVAHRQPQDCLFAPPDVRRKVPASERARGREEERKRGREEERKRGREEERKRGREEEPAKR